VERNEKRGGGEKKRGESLHGPYPPKDQNIENPRSNRDDVREKKKEEKKGGKKKKKEQRKKRGASRAAW